MVQLFYYDTATTGKCKKLLACYGGGPIRVLLYQEEDCPGPGLNTHLMLKFPLSVAAPWLCRVSEFAAGKKVRSAWARIRHSGDGRVAVTGRFAKTSCIDFQHPDMRDFMLCLTSRVSEEDFQQGYSLTGWLEMGCKNLGDSALWRVTHAAMVRRRGY